MRSPDRPATPLPFGVVVVNWNGIDDTLRCVESLRAAEPGPARVLVVDNGSRVSCTDALLAWGASRNVAVGVVAETDEAPTHWLSALPLAENRGFSGGNNAGIRLLLADRALTHVLLLNNDAAVAPDHFARLHDAIAAAPDAGIVSGTIYEGTAADGTTRVWWAGGEVNVGRALVSHRHERPADGRPRDTAFVTGCAMAVSREAFERAGLLATCYHPGYLEDAEFTRRVRDAGLRALYAPDAVAWHRVGASFGRRDAPWLVYVKNRNRFFWARRTLSGTDRVRALAYLVATKPARALAELLRGRPRLAWAYARATAVGLLAPTGGR